MGNRADQSSDPWKTSDAPTTAQKSYKTAAHDVTRKAYGKRGVRVLGADRILFGKASSRAHEQPDLRYVGNQFPSARAELETRRC